MQARIAERNAAFEQQVYKQNADLATSIGERNVGSFERISRRDAARRLGSFRAAAGASGFSMGGSLLESLADRAAKFEEETIMGSQNIRFAAQSAARQGELGSIGAAYRGELARLSGRAQTGNIITGGLLDAGSTYITAAQQGLIL